MWVPLAARHVCYQCGSHIPGMADKDNCRMCSDAFCNSCLNQKQTLPVTYGYTTPQPVCKMCSLLINTFPTFASRLHTGQGGMLLPPKCAVIVTFHELPYNPDAALDGSLGDGKKGGLFSLFKRDSAVAAASAAKAAGADPPSSYCRHLPDAQSCSVRPDNAVLITAVGWRPMNPDTTIVIGSVSLAIKDIHKICLGDDKVSGKAVNDGRITITLRSRKICQLVVGSVSSESQRSTRITNTGDMEGDEISQRFVEFTTDPAAAAVLVASLSSLVKACRAHFAFGRASLALHKDMCPM